MYHSEIGQDVTRIIRETVSGCTKIIKETVSGCTNRVRMYRHDKRDHDRMHQDNQTDCG